MSKILINQLSNFSTFKVDTNSKYIINQNCSQTVNLDEFFKLSHILDNSYIDYKVDQNINIIILGKK